MSRKNAPKGYGYRYRTGELASAFARGYAGAIRHAVRGCEPIPGISWQDLRPHGDEGPLNDHERESWRVLYRRGVRIVRVELHIRSTP